VEAAFGPASLLGGRLPLPHEGRQKQWQSNELKNKLKILLSFFLLLQNRVLVSLKQSI